ncbi:MAG: hypothetical protein DMF71_16960 [Acidobacteria bacterium]|nr:MAG: hypothetical protein DMF71_16960 [Acidobacteriota bacterium]
MVQDGVGNTIITEVPCPCCASGSPFQSRIAGARSSFDSKLTAQTFFQNPNIPVRIIGVGMFDFLHGQTGVAPNGIELHAILDIALPTTQTASTNPGSNVTTTAGDATINFTSVSSGGLTTVAPIEPSSAGPALAGYGLVGPAFNISTAATTTGPYNVCISVPYITDQAAFASLKLLHNEGGILVDHTTIANFSNKIVCASTPTLSPFVVATGPSVTVADGDVTGNIADQSGAPVEGVAVRMSGTQNRLTITDANGDYHFDSVETNGVYTIAPARANYSFSPPQRSFSQLGQHTDAVFTGSLSGSANPLDTTEYFVRQQYLDFLGREPDEAGFNFWVNNLQSCGGNAGCLDAKRRDTSAAFFFSIEFQNTGFLVYRMYQAAYGSGDLPGTPAPFTRAEFLPATRALAANVVVNQGNWQAQLADNQRAYAYDFVSSARFTSSYSSAMTPDQFVDQLFQDTGAVPSPAERAAAIAEFGMAMNTADTAARAHAIIEVAENSSVARSDFNRAFVLMEYFGYLGRNPDDPPDGNFDGYNYWLAKLNRFGGDYRAAQMVEAFLEAREYRSRFPR